jgi:hypothetical protein
MKKHGWLAAVVVLILFGVAAVGCSAGSGSSSSSDRASTPAGGAGAAAGPAVDGQPRNQLGEVLPRERRQIQTGDIALVASSPDDVGRVADAAVSITTEAGGQIDGDRRSGGDTPTVDLVLRVPPTNVDTAVQRIAALATVQNRSVQTEDVTNQFTDLEGRIQALQTSTARLRGFLAATTDVNQITSLESELTKRETTLESLEGQLRVLSGKADMATLKVSISTDQSVPAASVPSPADALIGGWNALRLILAGLIDVFLVLAPFLVMTALVALAARWLLNWFRRRFPQGPKPGGRPSATLPPPPGSSTSTQRPH